MPGRLRFSLEGQPGPQFLQCFRKSLTVGDGPFQAFDGRMHHVYVFLVVGMADEAEPGCSLSAGVELVNLVLHALRVPLVASGITATDHETSPILLVRENAYNEYIY